MSRTLSKILIQADATKSLTVLGECWNEILENKYYFSINELEFAKEHIEMLARKFANSDMEEIMKTLDI